MKYVKIRPDQIPPFAAVWSEPGPVYDCYRIIYGCRICEKFSSDGLQGYEVHLFEKHGIGSLRVRTWANRGAEYDDLPFASEVEAKR